MANLNGAAHIASAVRSVLRQTERSLELIISDDGSNDDSLAIAERTAAGDPRIILLRSEATRTGPGAARNRALAVASGRWIAIVDNDDAIHPERLERLIGAVERDGADIAADDLIVFYENGDHAPHAHLKGAMARAPRWVSAAEYEHSNRVLSGRRALGYLKPVLRRDLAPGYDESLRIAEDADLVLRLLVQGARLRVYPEIGYFYRKHARSISHRLDAAAIDAMDAAHAKLDVSNDPALAREVRAGRAAMADARAFTQLVAALKARDLGAAVQSIARRPAALRLLKDPIGARLPKRRAHVKANVAPVTLLSRQRIVGATNGSSAYVLALARALKQAGFAVDYLAVSPKVFGRWAVLPLKPEIQVFHRYRVRGGVRLGDAIIATDVRIWAASALAVIEAALGKLGLAPGWSKPAEAAQRAAATRADQLFIARQAAPNARAVLCDYAFVAPLGPYALATEAPRFTIMHDLMSGRIRDPGKHDAYDLTAEEEFRLLRQTDSVIAIQEEEARAVRAAVPHADVFVVPHAVVPVAAAQPGADDALLFVGSNTPPNVTGLERFFAEIWPAIRARRPGATLKVAGSVNRAFTTAPEGVRFLGVVEDLAPLYRDAGIVISPLTTGSGLKIKLIEAMAAGKAVVGTSVTLQGVEDIARGAMMVADEPPTFAEAVIALAADSARREALGRAVLAVAREHFSPDRAAAPLIARVRAASAAREGPPALSRETDKRDERADENERKRGVQTHLADQQPG
jgi:glycosyltransferase involved in cell wall biosynthesis